MCYYETATTRAANADDCTSWCSGGSLWFGNSRILLRPRRTKSTSENSRWWRPTVVLPRFTFVLAKKLHLNTPQSRRSVSMYANGYTNHWYDAYVKQSVVRWLFSLLFLSLCTDSLNLSSQSEWFLSAASSAADTLQKLGRETPTDRQPTVTVVCQDL